MLRLWTSTGTLFPRYQQGHRGSGVEKLVLQVCGDEQREQHPQPQWQQHGTNTVDTALGKKEEATNTTTRPASRILSIGMRLGRSCVTSTSKPSEALRSVEEWEGGSGFLGGWRQCMVRASFSHRAVSWHHLVRLDRTRGTRRTSSSPPSIASARRSECGKRLRRSKTQCGGKTICGSFQAIDLICRHIVGLRGRLYVSSEPSFPILLKCIDFIRQTKTIWEESIIGDFWNVVGHKTLSEDWIGFVKSEKATGTSTDS